MTPPDEQSTAQCPIEYTADREDPHGEAAPPAARGLLGWKIERRPSTSRVWEAGALLLTLLAASIVSSLLILSAGAGIRESLRALVRGAFGSRNALLETLVQATPLVFTGLAVTVAFRGRIWNIGAEGQFFAGTIAVFWAANAFANLPPIILVPLVVVAGGLAGAFWGGIAGFLKARYGASEVIVTVMLNFIVLRILSFLLSDAWQDPSSYFYQTALMSESSYLPRLLGRGRLHLGFVLSLVTAIVVYVVLWRTVLGYEIRAIGSSPTAAGYKGISVPVLTVVVLAVSGAIAGLGGASELAGLHHRLRLDISTGYGFTGIIIALLGRLHPAGVVIAAIFFGALVNGSLAMQIATGVPVALVQAIQGVTLIFLLTAEVLTRYRIRRVGANG
jgi:simple sugar transport system permease protein